MKVTEGDAKILAMDYMAKLLKEHFQNCSPVNLTRDMSYSSYGYDGSKWWYLPLPDFGSGNVLQVGGCTRYIVVSKMTGDVSILLLCGE